MKLRRGRKVGRTLYVQRDADPSDDDVLVGTVDSPELAAFLIEAVCWYLERAERREPGAREFTSTRTAFDRAVQPLLDRPRPAAPPTAEAAL